jgi:tetratricopeptide (TPR) repeat protein
LTSDNPFTIRQIRDTVQTNFESLEAKKEWLPIGVGPHYTHLKAALKHAHRAVELDPLQGDSYLILAELDFLEDSAVPTRSAYVDQAYRVRPNDGWVLFEIGSEMTLAGRFEEALSYLKRSFRRGRQHQQRLIQAMAGKLPVQVVLKEFQPDADAMQLLLTHYTHAGLVDELDVLLAAHATACESKAQSLEGEAAARYWASAARSHKRLGNTLAQHQCLKRAVGEDATNFDYRLEFGRACTVIEDYVEAEKQGRWCTQHKPENSGARALLDQAVEKRIASANRHAPMKEAGLPSAQAWR